MIRPRLLVLILAVLPIALLAPPAAAEPAPIPETWVGIGTLSGRLSSAEARATDVNDAGQVVGWSLYEGGTEDDRHPFLYDTETGEMTDLGDLGDILGRGEATAINDAGMVVGFSNIEYGPFHPFLWDPTTETMTDLGTLGTDPAHTEARATGINDTTIVGWSYTKDGGSPPRAFTYDIASETMSDLGTLGGEAAIAEDINEAGEIVGYSTTGEEEGHAFLYQPTGPTWTDLGTLAGETTSYAYALNDTGIIVGLSFERPFVYHRNTSEMQEIGSIEAPFTTASDVNDAGIVIGTDQSSGAEMYLYDANAEAFVGGGYPPVEGPDHGAAGAAINNANLAVGSYYTGRATHAVLLAPWTFRDVEPSHPFFDDIEWMAAEGISTGFGDDTYRPADDVTRQSMAAFLYRLAGSPPFTPPSTPSFPDVPSTHPFFDEIEWLVSEDITTGFPDGGYHPGGDVTRQSMSAFLYRLAGEPAFTPPAIPSFPDVPTSHPFYDEIEWMVAEEVTTGFPDGTFRPGSPVTRQAMSAFMHRYADGPGAP